MPVYIVTGSNRGIGLEFIRQLAQSPANTVLATTRSLTSDLTALRSVASPSTHILECDTGSVESIQSFVAQAAALLKDDDGKVDFLINNGAINIASWRSSLQLDPAELAQQITTNVVGPAKTVEFLHAAGLLSPDVRILNMSSGLGSMVESGKLSPRKAAPYSISKAGVNMLVVHQSGDLKKTLPGVVVIAMDPGWVKTSMGGEGAILEPSESVGNMLGILHGLAEKDNGKFYHHSGREVPW